MMTRLICSLAPFPYVAFILWLGGFDLTQRSPYLAFWAVLATVIAAFVWSYPGWKYRA